MEMFEGLSEPVRKAWERSLTSGRASLSRRRVLGAGLGVVGAGALSACGIPAATNNQGGVRSDDLSDKDKSLVFSNWQLYIDMSDDEKHMPTLEAFEKKTGIKVKYSDDITDNVEFFAKIKPQLAAGQSTGRDLVVLTDWMAARMIRLGWAQPLDPTYLPHAFTNLEQRFRNPDWDPGRAHSYPWQGIATVIAYNEKATKGKKVGSVSQLLDDPDLKGRVAMLSEMRDTIGMTLLDMGKQPESFTADDFDAAVARVQKAVDGKQIRQFTGNEYTDGLASGNIAACVAWAGDLVQLQADNPEIKFVIPSAGYIYSTDNMLVPAGSKHRKNAERLMDWYYQPAIAAELAAWVNYITPCTGVYEELLKIDEDVANNPLIIPNAEMKAKAHPFRSLSSKEETAFEDKFAKLIGA
ncbi:spermidine/putrescine ABC transporter substrate-binding protein [Actinacidiphila glaucinigra]|uniref:polyamine ABC transporter substrate-binding protein n=1 Tax=Actinacidiphila glaucinigra TaxID=235986 RepID=UPI002E30627C|nr:spermidine/putrescine ABC transporter substrate-binding protein [Actinacidiphila glaucinigra]